MPRKEIVPENTRFPGGFFDKPTNDEERKILQNAVDATSGTPMVGGYKLMRTPSPSPGRDNGGESPFMTWGDIVGTPFHLRDEDDDDDENDGQRKRRKTKSSGFRVPATPSREELAWKLDSQVTLVMIFSFKRNQSYIHFCLYVFRFLLDF